MTSARERRPGRARPGKILGILGGLGPWAHLDLERKLLDAARRLAGAVEDQDYPEWILSSVPGTPDRTAGIEDEGPSPLPWMIRSLHRLETRTTPDGVIVPGADFVIVACNSAHHYLDELRRSTEVEVLDLIGECAGYLAARFPAGSRIGVLATTGTLRSGLYQRALRERGLEPRSPRDLPEGDARQRDLVMGAVYGRDGQPGLKTEGASPAARAALLEAARLLVEELGCVALVAGCTEIPLALTEPEVEGVPLVDAVEVIARVAIARVYDLDLDALEPPRSPG